MPEPGKAINLPVFKSAKMQIRNIIFDLGGVLLNLDTQATIEAFRNLGIHQFDNFFTLARQDHLFDKLDKGEYTPEEFYQEIRRISGLELEEHKIDQAWNAMLLDLPSERIKLLEQARNHYNTYLLSNTNSIHYPAYTRYLKEAHGYESLAGLFNNHYLSHEIGMRKPDVEIFSFVIKENGLNPAETLFIDDSPQHVEGSRKAGLWGYWLDLQKEKITDLFEEGKLRDSVMLRLQNQ